ncbi:hypothetical protein GGS24DRAFT_511687 [Hypoxylon argillaceum]|nr:hypothetical protein GGS24DRAFT_511687 [Hypoxylon argillaceum]
MHPHPECEGLSPSSVQLMPYDHHDRHDTDLDLESADEKNVDTNSTDSSETETVFSQNDESVVTRPTSFAPSSKGLKGKEKETITISSFDGSITVDLKGTWDTPKRLAQSPPIIGTSPEDDGAGRTNSPSSGLIITPSMNSSLNWGASAESVPAFVNDRASSSDFPTSVREGIDLFVADLGSTVMPSTSGSDVGGDLGPTYTAIIPAISAVAKDGGSLQYTVIYRKARLSMLSSRQMKEVLSPKNLRDVCTFCQQCPSSMMDFLGFSVALDEPQYNTGLFPRDEIINCLFKIMTQGLDRTPKIRCWPHGPADIIAALRFGYKKEIVLHSLETGEPITFVCCDETFPSPRWAREATEAFIEGANSWATAGLTFQQVERNKPAHFRIAFSIFHKDLDCGILARAFLPGVIQPEERTLWVYLLAFHPQYRHHMAGYMGHEAGHIGGSRHRFDEHILPDGSEIAENKSVTMGPDNPKSVMNYHDDPADYVVQSSDIRDMQDMYSHAKEEYKEHKFSKVKPTAQVYPPMLSFEFVVRYLLRNANG